MTVQIYGSIYLEIQNQNEGKILDQYPQHPYDAAHTACTCIDRILFKHPDDRQVLTLCFFLAAGLTDCLDGYFARRYNQITMLGKVLDPIADKLFTASVVFCLTMSGVISWSILGIIVVKGPYMGVGAIICLKRKVEVVSDIYGKIATVLFYPAVLRAWPWHGLNRLAHAGRVMIYISVGLSVFAAVHYTLSSIKAWKAMKQR